MKTGHKRLLKLVDILRTVPRKQFNMDVWSEERKCGTVACAAGYACMDPGFKRAGLFLCYGGGRYGDYTAPELRLKDGSFVGDEWRALEQFFDLDACEAELLFMPGKAKYDTPRAVADHIERFVRNYDDNKLREAGFYG